MRHRTAKLDRIAVQLSGLCLLHCLALPVLMACVPVLGLAEHWHDRFHQMMLFVVVPLAVVALGRGFRQHRRPTVIALGTLGIGLLAYAALVLHAHVHGGHDHVGEAAERWMTVVGALILAGAHLYNARAARQACACHHDSDAPAAPVRQTPPIARQ